MWFALYICESFWILIDFENPDHKHDLSVSKKLKIYINLSTISFNTILHFKFLRNSTLI